MFITTDGIVHSASSLAKSGATTYMTPDGIVHSVNRTKSPSVKLVRPLDDYKLQLWFSNGDIKVFDAKPYLKYPAYKSLSDKAVFDTVYLRGDVPSWGDGEIDFDPERLYREGAVVSGNAVSC